MILLLRQDMFHIAGQSNFIISTRIAGALAVICAMVYGVYIAAYGSVAAGLVWVMSAMTLGWVGNMVFSLLLVLVSEARHSAARHTAGGTKTNARFREARAGSGGRLPAASSSRALVVSGSRKSR
jgi:hypothetical protein